MKKILSIESERLIFFMMDHEDCQVLKSMLQDLDVMYAWERTLSDDEVVAWIDRNIQRYKTHGFGYYLVMDRNLGEVVGQIGLIPEEIEGKVFLGIGWILRKKFWGNGYAVEGAKCCIDYAFKSLEQNEVIADIRPNNLSSIAVAQKAGMRLYSSFTKIVDGKEMLHNIYRICNDHKSPTRRIVNSSANENTDEG